MRKSLFWRIFAGHAAIILAVAGAAILVMIPLVSRHHIAATADGLEKMALALEDSFVPYLLGRGEGDLEEVVRAVGARTRTRVTVIDASGTVLADSEREPRDMENHLYRPEIQASLRGEKAMSVRRSSTLGQKMMYLSVPLSSEGRVIGVLRMSRFMAELSRMLSALRLEIVGLVSLAAALALAVALLFTHSIARPLREFVEASVQVAQGRFDVKVSTRQSGELKAFARSFNAMTERLRTMFEEVRLRDEEITNILRSIREGLAVVEEDGRIILSNDAFRRIAGQDAPEGRFLWEAVRSPSLNELLQRVRTSRSAASGEAELGDRTFHCHASPLPSARRIVVTLHDVSEARRLEKIKKEFVANVSHELKTPLAAIKGFAETMAAKAQGEDKRHLAIIARNTDRLIAIVEDLLALSRLEERGVPFEKSRVDVAGLVQSLLRIFEGPAAEKGLSLTLEAPPGLPNLMADPVQIETLLLNLIDNAIKYTERGRVMVRLGAADGQLLIEVEDTGIGIDAVHLPHVFDRFYVVDKSRSRKLGGTGLGLSIVKHVVLSHQGTVDIRSRVGEGTVVTVRLPLA